MNMDINSVVDAAVMAGLVESGMGMALAGRNEPLSGLDRRGMAWMEEEEDFLRENAGRMPEDEICLRLGRSVVAVTIHRKREMRLASPIKDPEYITGYKLSKALGISDPRKISNWIRADILEGEMVPYRNHDVSRVRLEIVLAWLVKPESWMYFHPERVADPNLRRRIGRAVEAWGDEWWSTKIASEYHRVDVKDILRAIKLGRVQAVQIKNLSGRHEGGRWGFWFVRRSECVLWDRRQVFRKRI